MRWKRTELAYLVCIHPCVRGRLDCHSPAWDGVHSARGLMEHLQAECAEMLGAAA
jgi:hypothetical protein